MSERNELRDYEPVFDNEKHLFRNGVRIEMYEVS